MFRHFVSFVLYVLTIAFLVTILFPVPWFSYSIGMMGLHQTATISPFYFNETNLYFSNSYAALTVRDIVGILSLIIIWILFYSLGRRNKAFRTGDRFVLSSMRYGFGVSIFLLVFIAILFYATIPRFMDPYGHYNEAILFGFLIFFLFVGSMQSPSVSAASYVKRLSNTPLRSTPTPGAPSTQQTIGPQAEIRHNPSPQNDDRDSIGVLGPVASGKSTMLAYFIHFLKDTTRSLNVNYEVVQGQEFYRNFLDDLLRNQRFPGATGVESPNRMLIKFYTQAGLRKKSVYLEVNDVAGELFSKTSSSPQRRREAFAYLSSCFANLFIIDCGSYKDWTIEDLRFASILDDLYRAVGDRKGVKSPIAFIFTKSDLLPEAVHDKSPMELLSSLRNTISFVESHFKDYSAFKTYIQTERNASGELVPKVDTLAGARVDILYNPQMNYGFQQITDWICKNGDLI